MHHSPEDESGGHEHVHAHRMTYSSHGEDESSGHDLHECCGRGVHGHAHEDIHRHVDAHAHTHSHVPTRHAELGCCGDRGGRRMVVEGPDAEHFWHAAQVRTDWLASAMARAEEEDRTEGVWDLHSDRWEAGDVVEVNGLVSRPDLNGATGILLHWVKASQRWGVAVVSTDERVKIKPTNLAKIGSRGELSGSEPGGAAHISRMPRALRRPVDPASQPALVARVADQLLLEHYAVIDGFLGEEGAAPVRELLQSLHAEGELQPGDVAGGRAAAAYARITGQALPRGDLLALLDNEGAAKYPRLIPLLTAMDELMAGLARAPALAAELAGRDPLCRQEVQLTCYPARGTRYVRHVDNNDEQASGQRRGGRLLTAIYYPNQQVGVPTALRCVAVPLPRPVPHRIALLCLPHLHLACPILPRVYLACPILPCPASLPAILPVSAVEQCGWRRIEALPRWWQGGRCVGRIVGQCG